MSIRGVRQRVHPMWVGATMVALVAVVPACAGQSYSCGTGVSGHCYGVVEWSGNFTGFSMEETPVSLASGDIFVDDEGWLTQRGVSGGTSLNSQYWVETGEINEGFGTDYFWADNRADAGFMYYDLGPVSQSDIKSGNWIAYQVRQDPKTASTWNVTISRAASGTVLATGQSVDNPITPNTVIEGQELAGQHDAQANIAFFSENSVFHSASEMLQTSNGTVTRDNPPNADWWPGGNKPSETTDGGLFFTDCC